MRARLEYGKIESSGEGSICVLEESCEIAETKVVIR